MPETKNHWNKGKQHALKPAHDRSESFIHARCKSSDKIRWKLAAEKEGLKLTEWIVKNLNNLC